MIFFDSNDNMRVIEYNHLGVAVANKIKQAVATNQGKAK